MSTTDVKIRMEMVVSRPQVFVDYTGLPVEGRKLVSLGSVQYVVDSVPEDYRLEAALGLQ